jgi:hypothetical protein
VRQVVLRVVTDIGQRVSCWGCSRLERSTKGSDGDSVAGLCAFHGLAFDTRADAQQCGCTFWRRRSRASR